MRRPSVTMLAVLCAGGLVCPASGAERSVNRFDTRQGLPVAHVLSLAQDLRGFIWIGTMGGLVRLDGHEMRPTFRDFLHGEILAIVPIEGDALLVHTQSSLFEVDDSGVRQQLTEDGSPLVDVTAVAGSGRAAWTLAGGRLFARSTSGRWRAVVATFDDEPLRVLRPGANGDVLVITDRSLWRMGTPGSNPTRVARLPAIAEAMAVDGGYVAVTFDAHGSRVVQLGPGQRELAREPDSRPLSVVRRGEVIWAAFDRFLVALHPDRPEERMGATDGIPSGGPLLVDAENNLWLGTYLGLLQFPEPEAVTWTERDGLPSSHARSLLRTSEGVWISTWQGLGRLARTPAGWRALDEHLHHHADLCTDASGRLLVMNEPDGPWFVRQGGRFVGGPPPDHDWLASCARSGSGGVWYATDHALWFAEDGGGRVRTLTVPQTSDANHAVLEDRHGRLWLTRGSTVCHEDAARVLAGRARAWRCDVAAGARTVNALTETPGGAIWAATQDAGVWRWTQAAGWREIAASRGLASRTLRGFSPARDGSIWLLGAGIVVRVREIDEAAGWTVVERLTSYQGLLSEIAESLIEEADGTVWIATTGGVTRVPAAVRRATPPAPRVELVTSLVDGHDAEPRHPLSMSAGRNTLELRYAVLTYRDRGRLRFQLRLDPGGDWTESAGDDTSIRFLNLGAGSYTVRARASLDGVGWSEARPVSFEVMTPWYRTGWATFLALLAMGGVAVGFHRMRLAVVTQLGRQRARIARDLHDELGSGLGSIGILAGLASGPAVSDDQRRELTATISETVDDLNSGLSDLVWSMSRRPVGLAALATHLADRGARLVPGPRPEFQTRGPSSWPSGDLPMLVRRNVTLIALEAIRNAVRHADADRIVLTLEPAGVCWILTVADDGRGLATTPESDAGPLERGHGRENIATRAREIGAGVEWLPAPGGGTIVRLRFDPFAAGSMARRWRRGSIA